MPYSQGARDCAGQSLARMSYTATVAMLFAHFSFVLTPEVLYSALRSPLRLSKGLPSESLSSLFTVCFSGLSETGANCACFSAIVMDAGCKDISQYFDFLIGHCFARVGQACVAKHVI